ncbi:MAG TPA: hypothetical protein VF984_06755 [Actinomycetota bacterium]
MSEQAAFEGFYREHVGRVVRACTLVLLDLSEAGDVAAEAFARLWSRWNVIEDDDHAGGYVRPSRSPGISSSRRPGSAGDLMSPTSGSS